MIEILLIIALIVIGVFGIIVLKAAAYENRNLKERNVHLLKRCRDERKKAEKIQFKLEEIKEDSDVKEKYIDALKLEIKGHEIVREEFERTVNELNQEKLALSLELQKMGK